MIPEKDTSQSRITWLDNVKSLPFFHLERPPRRIINLALILSAILAILHLFYPGGEEFVTLVTDLASLLFSFGAAVASALLWQSTRKGEILRTIWASMTMGLVLWTIGEVIWAYDTIVLGIETPFPSVADFVWVIGYIPISLSLSERFRSLKVHLGKRLGILLVLTALAILVLVVIFVIAPILAYPDYGSQVEMALNTMYALGNGTLLILALAASLVFQWGRLAFPWRVLTLGIALSSISDLLFSYASWHDLYRAVQVGILLTFFVDWLYACGYIFWGTGIFLILWYDRAESRSPVVEESLHEADHLLSQARVGTGAPAVSASSRKQGTSFLVMVDGLGRIVFTEESLVKLLGFSSAGGLVGEPLHRVASSAGGLEADRLVRQLEKEGKIQNHPMHLLIPAKQECWLSGTAAYNEQGGFMGADLVLHLEKQAGEVTLGSRQDSIKRMTDALLAQVVPQMGWETIPVPILLKGYTAVISNALFTVLLRMGGLTIGKAAEARFNSRAKILHTGIEMEKGHVKFPEGETDAKELRALLSEMVEYTVGVVSAEVVASELTLLHNSLDPQLLGIVEQAGLKVKLL